MPGPQPCHCRLFIFRIAGSGLDRSAGRRRRRPLQRRSVNLPPPYTPAGGYGIRPYAQTKPPCRGRACPARSLAVAAPFIFCIVGSGLDRSAGRRGRRPLQRRSVNLPLPYTPAGGYGIRPYAQTKPPCRGRACPARSLAVAAPFIFCIVGSGLDRSAGRRGRRPLQRRSVNLPPPTPRADRKSAPAHKQKPLPMCNHRQRLSIFQSRLIHTAGTSSSTPRPSWRPRPSCSQSQTRSLQCSRQSPSSRRDPCRGS